MAQRKPSASIRPKYERVQQVAARLPELRLDVSSVWPFFAMLSIVDEISAANDEFFGRYGLSEGRVFVLLVLLEHLPKPMSPSDVAELVGVTRGNMTGLVDGLQRDGYVERQKNGDDRRMTPIALTPAGKKLIRTLLPQGVGRIHRLMSSLSAAERETLLSLIAKLREGLPRFRSGE